MCRGDRFSYFPQLACKLVSTFDDGWRVCCVFLKEGCAMMFEGTGGGIALGGVRRPVRRLSLSLVCYFGY